MFTDFLSLDLLTLKNIVLLALFIWGRPLMIYRLKFRKLVYQTDSWKIAIKPVFLKEIKGLFSNLYPENGDYLKMRDFYRKYLVVEVGLLILFSAL